MSSRIIRRRPSSPGPNLLELARLMKSISDAQEAAANAMATIAADSALLLAAMQKAGTRAHSHGLLVAEITQSAGRSSNTIDPKGFRKLVKNDKDFFECISVSNTAAKKLLPEKVLNSITQHTPAKPGPEAVKVSKRGS